MVVWAQTPKENYLSLGSFAKTLSATLLFTTLVFPMPGNAVTLDGVHQVSQLPEGYHKDGPYCLANAGSNLASSANGQRLILSDAYLFNGCYPDSVSSEAVWLSNDGGETWIDSGLPISYWGPVASSADGKYLVAAAYGDTQTNGGSLWISNNFGLTWSEVITSSKEVGTEDHNHKWWDIDMSDDGRIIVAISDHQSLPHISFDYGQTWQIPGGLGQEDASASAIVSWRGGAISGDGETLVLCHNSDSNFKLFYANLGSAATSVSATAFSQIAIDTKKDPGLLNNCGSLDLDQDGNKLITGSYNYSYKWIGVFEREGTNWSQSISHDFANGGVYGVQVSDDGLTLIAAFYDNPNVAVSFDGGEYWTAFQTSNAATSMVGISGDGSKLFAHDYEANGFYVAELNANRRSVPDGEQLLGLPYFSPVLISNLNRSDSPADSISLSNSATSAAPEGADYDPATGLDWMVFEDCTVATLDISSGLVAEKVTLSDQLAELIYPLLPEKQNPNDEDPRPYCGDMTATGHGSGYIATNVGVFELDFENELFLAEPFGSSKILAMAFDPEADELWVVEDAIRLGLLSTSSGELTAVLDLDKTLLNQNNDSLLEKVIAWGADFDSTGKLWLAAWEYMTPQLVSLDVHAPNIAATVKFQGLPTLANGDHVGSDAIWFRPIATSNELGGTDTGNFGGIKTTTVALPTIKRAIMVANNEIRLEGTNLGGISGAEISGKTAIFRIMSSEKLILSQLPQLGDFISLTLRGDFGTLTIDRIQVVRDPKFAKTHNDKRLLLNAKTFGNKVSLQGLAPRLKQFSGSNSGIAVCTGYTIGDLSKPGVRTQALMRAKKVCEKLVELNPELTMKLEVAKAKYFGRSVHISVTSIP